MNKIFFGDCRDILRGLDAGIVQCCVTSPPYFGLRDYGHPGQLGLEPTPDEYVAGMVAVFREVRRVLRDDGTLWLNLGDSYSGSTMTGGNAGINASGGDAGFKQKRQFDKPPQATGLKPKDLIGIPWRVAFALQADGWYLRQDIIWHKPNPMPESVRDRCTKAHEYLFLLSKSERYFFDSEAMKEPADPKNHRDSRGIRRTAPGSTEHSGFKDGRYYETRNRRSVWTVTTKPYKGAHFATFPPALIDPCILAGSSEKGHCPECGEKWVRVVEKTKSFESGSGRSGNKIHGKQDLSAGDTNSTPDIRMGPVVQSLTIGWEASCSCGFDPVPDIVLDPFMGSGTTAEVAIRLGRQYLGCELNPEYGALQGERIARAVDDVKIASAQQELPL